MASLLLSFTIILAGLVAQQHAKEMHFVDKAYYDDLIEKVNGANPQWTADHNFEHGESIHNLLGSLQRHDDTDQGLEVRKCRLRNNSSGLVNAKVGAGRPMAFNGLEAWKNACPSVGHVWNQGECAADWVIAPVSAIADRLCIASNGTYNARLSPELPLACCKGCGWGCKKGYPSEVFKYWVKNGLVSGGAYHSNQGCQPYTIQPKKKLKKMYKGSSNTPQCKTECYNSNYKKSFSQDIIKGRDVFKYNCPCCSAYELWENGPLTATFRLYEDFLTYRSGVYHHVHGKFLGMLTVKVVGYNDTADPKYWIAVNSWGKRWGDDGTFKIRRYTDECMFESSLHGADTIRASDEDYDSDESFDR